MPNVHFTEDQALGTAVEIPRDSIPFEKVNKFYLKPEADTDPLLDGFKLQDYPLGEQSSGTQTRSLKSGKMVKPDESGIKKVVQFAHEKLDSVYVKSRVFSELSFHFLVAGELELILQDSILPEERLARLHFLRMLSYHKEYLGVDDLKDQYDATLKNIERGLFGWADLKELEAQMQRDLTFRATVNACQGEVGMAQGGQSRRMLSRTWVRMSQGSR